MPQWVNPFHVNPLISTLQNLLFWVNLKEDGPKMKVTLRRQGGLRVQAPPWRLPSAPLDALFIPILLLLCCIGYLCSVPSFVVFYLRSILFSCVLLSPGIRGRGSNGASRGRRVWRWGFKPLLMRVSTKYYRIEFFLFSSVHAGPSRLWRKEEEEEEEKARKLLIHQRLILSHGSTRPGNQEDENKFDDEDGVWLLRCVSSPLSSR